jgi:hypothetical protein
VRENARWLPASQGLQQARLASRYYPLPQEAR